MAELAPAWNIVFPKHWSFSTLGELFEIQQGKAIGPHTRGGDSPFPFLRTANVLWGRVDLGELDRMDFDEQERLRLRLRRNDLLVCEGGDIGRTAIWRDEVSECYYQNHVHRLRPKTPRAWPEFYMYWMQAALLRFNLYGGHGNNTTIPNLSKGRLASFEVPVPPLDEQRAIAHVLSVVQQNTDSSQTVISSARALKQSILHRLFTHGVRVSDVRETSIGALPSHWAVRRLEDLCQLVVDCPHSTPRFTASGPRVVRNFNIKDGHLTLERSYYTTEEEYEQRTQRAVPQPGDILFSREAPIGEACVIPKGLRLSLGQRLMLLRPNAQELNGLFQVYSFYSPAVRPRLLSSGTGVTAPHMNVAEVRNLEVPQPPIEEQIQIASTLETIDEKLSVEDRRSRALHDLFSSLLGGLMSGSIRLGSKEVLALV